jgi:hypothetical protein
LIAAAPELLDSLRYAKYELECSAYPDHPAIKELEAVIAKAEGR